MAQGFVFGQDRGPGLLHRLWWKSHPPHQEHQEDWAELGLELGILHRVFLPKFRLSNEFWIQDHSNQKRGISFTSCSQPHSFGVDCGEETWSRSRSSSKESNWGEQRRERAWKDETFWWSRQGSYCALWGRWYFGLCTIRTPHGEHRKHACGEQDFGAGGVWEKQRRCSGGGWWHTFGKFEGSFVNSNSVQRDKQCFRCTTTCIFACRSFGLKSNQYKISRRRGWRACCEETQR